MSPSSGFRHRFHHRTDRVVLDGDHHTTGGCHVHVETGHRRRLTGPRARRVHDVVNRHLVVDRPAEFGLAHLPAVDGQPLQRRV